MSLYVRCFSENACRNESMKVHGDLIKFCIDLFIHHSLKREDYDHRL
jgi:hypothetical protein